ncbi:hypothetical protein M2360_002211 [Rhizobium sp. SG_E_25_P2]|uniref:hypothetical protein n=1 Tax=Rhizobium sp. SG_E_25_P2 TaxID=2879942 RepID=UPI002473C32A|nr:hypothetical protein [Rhizobium sp. SG_E_25_P2]MDH6266815.1 hypothetical protein [Rhizobium sp. SG_E_25_P2]
MLESAYKVGLNQAARTVAALSDRVEATPRQIYLENWRRRNSALDGLFYDVKVISAAETSKIGPSDAREGTILIVPPTGQSELRLCTSIDDFIAQGGSDVDIIAIAGVGSSALGSAAFARNVADALGRPAAAVVSGYGLADLMTEALGGYFLFGQLNGLRHMFEPLDALAKSHQPTISILAEQTARKSHDTRTVAAMLAHPKLRFTVLTGHSKGNLVLSEALYSIRDADASLCRKLAKISKIVTVSAVIDMPRPFSDITDVIGALDWFGGFNSRLDLRPDRLAPNAWHHTNTELPFALDVRDTFTGLVADGVLR